MDYFNSAFGSFHPQKDEDAAVKLILNAIASDFRLDELHDLLTGQDDVVAMEGEPGWFLETRPGTPENSVEWPPESRFRAYVDPDVYALRNPQFFMNFGEFKKYISMMLSILRDSSRDDLGSIERIKSYLNFNGDEFA